MIPSSAHLGLQVQVTQKLQAPTQEHSLHCRAILILIQGMLIIQVVRLLKG